MKKAYKYRSFMPWPENERRLDQAQKLGFNVSEVINEVLERCLDSELRKKTSQLRALLAGN